MDRIIYLAAVVLIPMAPAFLMFKFLPTSSVTASGPLHGLKVNMTGGFAAYIVVLLIGIAVVPKTGEALYTFEGYLALEADTSIDPEHWHRRIEASLIPPDVTPHPDGRLQFRFVYDPETPPAEQPSLYIKAEPCGNETIKLVRGSAPPGQRDYRLRFEGHTISPEGGTRILLSTSDPDPAQADTVRKYCGGTP